MFKYLRIYITALILIICVPFTLAYDPNDLVGSAFEFGDVDRQYFMSYFQDGNIITLGVGILCALMFIFFRKKIPLVLRVIWITFALTLILLPLCLMILGEGYGSIGGVFVISFLIGIYGSLVILPILLVYWIVSLIKFKSLKKSGIAIWNLLIKGVGTIPLTYMFAFGVFAIISLLAQNWNLSQCEKYVQSHYEDYDDIAPLMHKWEKEHTLQWGEAAKSHYSRSEEPRDSVVEKIEITEKDSHIIHD